MKSFFIGLIVIILLCQNTFADEIYLSNGNKLEGKYLGHQDSVMTFQVWLGRKVVSLEFYESQVDCVLTGTITKNDLLLSELKTRLDTLDRQNANDWFEIGVWCKKNKYFDDEAKQCFYKALEIDPEHQLSLWELGIKKNSLNSVLFEGSTNPPKPPFSPTDLDITNLQSQIREMLDEVLSGAGINSEQEIDLDGILKQFGK